MDPTPYDVAQQEQFYELHYPRLFAIAVSEFQIPEQEAERLVHDLLTTTLFRAAPPANLEMWLDGALKLAAARLAEVRA